MRKHIDNFHHHATRNYHITGAIITLITIFFINQFIDFNSVGIILNEFQNFFLDNLMLGILLFVGICIIILNSPIAITPVLYILAGYLYGPIFGTIISVISFCIASLIGFEIIRKFFRKKFQSKYEKKISKINKEIQEHGFHYFFSLRTMVIIPHYIITILAGLSKLNKKTFFSASALGFLPEAIVYNFAGSTLTNLTNLNEIVSIEIIVALALIVALGLVPVLQRIVKKHKIKKLKVHKFSDKPLNL
ncbi:MAG: TVP38/TMEM64 family protein [Nanoarchaeales archaeon]|nr:TVP38/TMEM64 family protein [Nanoarchaeales archaeon]